jgi:hypothetical protein
MAEFDPSQPYEVLSEGEVPEFDPTKPYEVVSTGEPPPFDPTKPYEVIRDRAPSLLSRLKSALAPGLRAMGEALAQDPEANERAGQAIRDTAVAAFDASRAGMASAARGALMLPGPLPGVGVANLPQAVNQPMTPLVQLPRVAQVDEANTAGQVAGGLANVGATVAEGMLTPLGIATLGAGGLSVGAGRLLAGAFGLDMARHLPEAAGAAGAALEEGTLQQQVEAVGNLAATAGFTGLTARHALTPNRVAAARGLAREIERAPLAEDAPTVGGTAPAPRVETVERGVSATDAVQAADALVELAPRVPDLELAADPLPAKPVPPAEFAARVKEVRRTAEEGGAEAALDAIADPTPTERSAVAVALGASDDVARALEAGRVAPDAAEAISRGAPGDSNAQQIGLAALRDGATPEEAGRAVRTFREEYGTTDAADVVADPAEMRRLRSGGSAMASPSAPAGLPSGTTPTTGTRMPVAVNRVVPGKQDIPGIMAQLERVMVAAGSRAPIRVGRMGSMKRWASAFFRPKQEVVRLNSASNIPSATHELAHDLAREFWARKAGKANASGILRGSVPKPVVAELRALGVRLYGSRKPAAGYIEEGWAEFVRHYLTTDDVATAAPATLAWFKGAVAPKFPAVMKELGAARDKIDVWRGQGRRGRATAMMKPYDSNTSQFARRIRKVLSVEAQVEQLAPLAEASRFWQERTGKALPPGQDPYLVASRLRGIGPSVLERFIDSGPVDIYGNRTGGMPLFDVLAPVLKGLSGWQRLTHGVAPKLAKSVQRRVEDFGLYLWSRRTIERAGKGQETGLSLDDARGLVGELDSPDFRLAADRYYQWWDDVLDYYAGSSPANAELVKAIKAGSRDYVPLPRVLDGYGSRTPGGAGMGPGGGLQRMRGSGRPVRDVMESTLKVAGGIIEKAHRDMVANTVIELAQKPGMGWLVEKVPVDLVQKSVSVGKLRQSLEAQGADLSRVPDDALAEYFTQADRPGGVDPVYPRRNGAGETEWYVLQPEVFDILTGVDNPKVAAGVLPALAAWNTRTFKMGTVGLRASFQLVTNPLRDFANGAVQMQGASSPGKTMMAYLASMGDMLRAAISPVSFGRITPGEWWRALEDLGVPMANSAAHDIAQTRSALRGAFHGRLLRAVTEPVNTFRDMISGMESVPRLAQLRIKAAEMGWEPGMALTPDQAVALTVAAKRVTTDFTAGGSVSRQANLYIPFFNVSIQGVRTAGRTLKAATDAEYAERNLTTRKAALGRVVVGGTFLMGLSLANWLRNRDQEWYRALPWRERFLFTNVAGPDGSVIRVPRPIEWGNLFMVMPEAIADWWYREDPETAVAAVEHIVASMNPAGLPVAVEAIGQQLANRDWFWDRPIVPRGQIDLPAGEQRSEYSSWLAKALGDAFPNHVSPRRVDAAIRQFGGGTATDLIEAIGLKEQLRERGWEPADTPIVGTLFRRGGQFTANSRHVTEFYDLYSFVASRARSKIKPLTFHEERIWKRLQEDKEDMDLLRGTAINAKEAEARQRLWRAMGERARMLNEAAKKLGVWQ